MATNKSAKKETASAKKTVAKPVAKTAAKSAVKPADALKKAKAAAAAKKAAKAAPVNTNDPEENIKRFAKTTIAMNFVKAHNGNWNHADWLNFLEEVKVKGYFPIDTDRVGLILEDKKKVFFSK